jgi:hypothetical protein
VAPLAVTLVAAAVTVLTPGSLTPGRTTAAPLPVTAIEGAVMPGKTVLGRPTPSPSRLSPD